MRVFSLRKGPPWLRKVMRKIMAWSLFFISEAINVRHDPLSCIIHKYCITGFGRKAETQISSPPS